MFVIAFDSDKHQLKDDGEPAKPAVLAGERRLIDALLPFVDVFSAEWDERGGKGLDDLLTNGGTFELVDRYIPPVPRPRVPRVTHGPGPVDGDRELADVLPETAQWVGRRFEPAYRNTATLIAPPPGTAKTGSTLRALETVPGDAMIGVGRHSQGDELVARAESENCRCGVPRGQCSEHRFVLNHDHGRNEDNCFHFDVIESAREAGYGSRVGAFICGTRDRPICAEYFQCGFQQQWQRPGSHVAALESVVLRPTSTDGVGTVVFDDLDSSRLITHSRVSADTVQRARRSPSRQPVENLLPLLERTISKASDRPFYHASAYDHLELSARELGTTLESVLAHTPPPDVLAPEPTVEGYGRALPGQLLDLIEILHEEFAYRRAGHTFTSGLRISASGIEIGTLLTPAEKHDRSTSLSGKGVAVLSSTPDPVLRQWMVQLGPEVLAPFEPKVALPPTVWVIQDTAGFYGKHTVSSHDTTRLVAKALAYLDELCPARPAVITHKVFATTAVEKLKLPPDRVLYFGNLRGSNALRDADCLIVIGCPGMSPDDAYWQACAAYHGPGQPPSQRQVMQYQAYGGWADELGRGREIEVLTFVDRRVAEIYEGSRRDELIQALFRCRPHDVGKTGDDRTALTIVLLTAMPVAGLRVDELRFGGNAGKHEDARRRLQRAHDQMSANGEGVTSRQLASLAKTKIEQAQTYLREVVAVRSPTCMSPLIHVGDQAATTPPKPSAPARAARRQLCACAPCAANFGDLCNCGKYWFEGHVLNCKPHCGMHEPKPAAVPHG